jgi:hypothetical protein
MQIMFKHLIPRRRRQAPRNPTGLADRRSGVPARRRPEPMPRMRWY